MPDVQHLVAVIFPRLFVIAIVAILTVERLYARVRRIVERIPLLRRIRPAVDELHRDTKVLFGGRRVRRLRGSCVIM